MKYSLSNIKRFTFSHKKVALLLVLLLVAGMYLYSRNTSTTTTAAVQTATVEKGTLVSSISASGTISAGNSVSITTQATGTVSKLLVKAGDSVKAGQTIAILTLDRASEQLQASAYANYLSAKNSLASAQNNLYTLQSASFAANQKLINDAVARDLESTDPTYIQENANWLKAEADYNNQSSVILQAQTNVTSAWLSYQQTASTITAPAAGTISNLLIAEGLPITATSTSDSASTQKLGTIATKTGQAYVSVNLSEVDVVKVTPGQKVTVTLDALSGKTFVGKVVVVDTSGQVSSGVTTYPATIAFDAPDAVYPNMAATAQIIISVKDNVLLVPSAAVQTANGQSSVRALRNGTETSVSIEVGASNDTQTEIVSGISEGDTVVVGTAATTSTTSQSQTSVFSNLGRGGFGGGTQVRINR